MGQQTTGAMSEAYCTHWRVKMSVHFSRNILKDISCRCEVILTWIFEKVIIKMWTAFV